MERRIKEADGYRVALKSLIESLEVALLIRKNLCKSSFSFLNAVSADHLTESGDSVCLEEHVLCAAKADTLGAQLTGFLSVCGCVGVGANLEGSELVSPCHDAAELACDLRVNGRDYTVVDITG